MSNESKHAFKSNIQVSEGSSISMTWMVETRKMIEEGCDYFWSGEKHRESDPVRYRQRIKARKEKRYANPHILGSC